MILIVCNIAPILKLFLVGYLVVLALLTNLLLLLLYLVLQILQVVGMLVLFLLLHYSLHALLVVNVLLEEANLLFLLSVLADGLLFVLLEQVPVYLHVLVVLIS